VFISCSSITARTTCLSSALQLSLCMCLTDPMSFELVLEQSRAAYSNPHVPSRRGVGKEAGRRPPATLWFYCFPVSIAMRYSLAESRFSLRMLSVFRFWIFEAWLNAPGTSVPFESYLSSILKYAGQGRSRGLFDESLSARHVEGIHDTDTSSFFLFAPCDLRVKNGRKSRANPAPASATQNVAW
jgi:hypothetical protein